MGDESLTAERLAEIERAYELNYEVAPIDIPGNLHADMRALLTEVRRLRALLAEWEERDYHAAIDADLGGYDPDESPLDALSC